MLKKLLIIILGISVLILSTTSCSGGGTGTFTPSNETNEEGKTTITVNNVNIETVVKDENGTPLSDMQVKGVDLGNGKILVYAGDPNDEYFTDYELIDSSNISHRNGERFAFTTAAFVLASAVSVGLVIYDYCSGNNDLPIRTVAELDESNNIEKKTVISLDIGDALNVMSLIMAGDEIAHAATVFGAPAAHRGVTAIKYGFTQKKLTNMLRSNALEQFLLYDLNTFVSKDWLSFTLYKEKGSDTWLPFSKWEFEWNPEAELPEYTFSLKWGQYPLDLDSYLYNDTWGNPIYWNNEGSKESWPFAVLDNDEIEGYGPENISIWSFNGDAYSYYVYNYSQEHNDSNKTFADSNALVTVLKKRELEGEFEVKQASGNLNNPFWYIGYIEKDWSGNYEFTAVNELLNPSPLRKGISHYSFTK